jgi:hypothetical protein
MRRHAPLDAGRQAVELRASKNRVKIAFEYVPAMSVRNDTKDSGA